MEITGQTKIMFVLAHPAGSVRASDVLNRFFQEKGCNVAVSPLDVAPEDLGPVLAAIRRMRNVVGFGVTMPNKIAVVPHLDHLTEEARQIGAINFVRRNADGTLLGDNLDGKGFLSGMLKNGIHVAGKRVLQIGAGGAGRATAFALARGGAREVFIVNRDESRATALAMELKAPDGTVVGRSGAMPAGAFDVIINATSLGMKPEDPLPLDPSLIGSECAVCDIVVNPPVTRLMEAAIARGAVAIGGKHMLDEQMELVKELVGI